MRLETVSLNPDGYPTREVYPFNQEIFQKPFSLFMSQGVTFFVGENGSGKSTLLRAMARRSRIHIWQGFERTRFQPNPHEEALYRHIELGWSDGDPAGGPESRQPSPPPRGSYFASEIFRGFSQLLDEWASMDPGVLSYFGGDSLMTQSHGQSHLAYFKSRFSLEGLYLLDEPENALSPRSQLAFMEILLSQVGHAQFVIATHSPLLLAFPDAVLYSFDGSVPDRIRYEETDHYIVYSRFLRNPSLFLNDG